MTRTPESSPGKWSRRILLRYALLQLPALGLLSVGLLFLHQFWALPKWLPWLVLGGWLLKDTLMYPLVWRAYDPDPKPQGNSLLGEQGRVVRITDSGTMIEIHGELWRARPDDADTALAIGTRVRVLAMDGLTLVVEVVQDKES
jgi:membrane protein implicated in regulation of membrane protease activity